jgi:hypothetical protein
VPDAGLGCFFRNEIGSGALLGASLSNHVAEAVDVLEHFSEVPGGTLKLLSITFAVEGLHRVLDGIPPVKAALRSWG